MLVRILFPTSLLVLLYVIDLFMCLFISLKVLALDVNIAFSSFLDIEGALSFIFSYINNLDLIILNLTLYILFFITTPPLNIILPLFLLHTIL